jgi:DNA-binding IclR family transcriptional regulator
MTKTAQSPSEKSRRGIQSIEIGGRLLTALVEEGGPMSLGDLARKAGMPSAKAHPYLVSFGNFGLIEQDPLTGRYELGPFALQLGLISLHLLDPVRIAIPMITQLAAEIDQTVGLSVLGNQGPTIIYIAESSYPIHVNMRTGTVMSIQSTATGRVFAAFLPPRQVERMIDHEKRNGIASAFGAPRQKASALDDILSDVRKRGMARVQGEPIPGINAICAPVFEHTGAIRLGITAIGPSGSFDVSWNGEIARRVMACAHDVSRRLGYDGR